MIRTTLLAAIGVVSVSTMATAQVDVSSGNAYISSCTSYISKQSNFSFFEGLCAGAVTAHLFLAHGMRPDVSFCAPLQVTVIQGVRVAVAYMQANPDQLHLPFQGLLNDAFRKAWPCRQ